MRLTLPIRAVATHKKIARRRRRRLRLVCGRRQDAALASFRRWHNGALLRQGGRPRLHCVHCLDRRDLGQRSLRHGRLHIRRLGCGDVGHRSLCHRRLRHGRLRDRRLGTRRLGLVEPRSLGGRLAGLVGPPGLLRLSGHYLPRLQLGDVGGDLGGRLRARGDAGDLHSLKLGLRRRHAHLGAEPTAKGAWLHVLLRHAEGDEGAQQQLDIEVVQEELRRRRDATLHSAQLPLGRAKEAVGLALLRGALRTEEDVTLCHFRTVRTVSLGLGLGCGLRGVAGRGRGGACLHLRRLGRRDFGQWSLRHGRLWSVAKHGRAGVCLLRRGSSSCSRTGRHRGGRFGLPLQHARGRLGAAWGCHWNASRAVDTQLLGGRLGGIGACAPGCLRLGIQFFTAGELRTHSLDLRSRLRARHDAALQLRGAEGDLERSHPQVRAELSAKGTRHDVPLRLTHR
mmetsp:Transcript_103267/g.308496  ORF Transcript_103267/g.308496 Transcript_103267/m.308496 type:complete len:453 (-) Transcript_103267:437-1795(-)